jgi:Spy/CpxP family protein refolding chaperone
MKIMSVLIVAIVAMLLTGVVLSDTHSAASPYAGLERRSVKALSPEEVADLQAGRGMGLAKVAELNHYPGPKHVLELAEPLALTGEQTQKVKQVHTAMEQEAQRLGKQLLAKETELEKLFAERRADETQARALMVAIGQLQGELRFAHVNAHLATGRLLSPAQLASYDRLRGYTAADRPANHKH